MCDYVNCIIGKVELAPTRRQPLEENLRITVTGSFAKFILSSKEVCHFRAPESNQRALLNAAVACQGAVKKSSVHHRIDGGFFRRKRVAAKKPPPIRVH